MINADAGSFYNLVGESVGGMETVLGRVRGQSRASGAAICKIVSGGANKRAVVDGGGGISVCRA